jgi:hypothetical protein
MIHQIDTKDFLQYIKKNNPTIFNIFSKNKKFLQKVIDTFYSQELLLQSLHHIPKNNSFSFLNIKDNNIDTHKDNYLLIPINADNI